MAHTTLIGTDVLAAHMTDATIAIVDCRFELADPAWGEQEHAAAHIPGASYAHLDRDLSGTKTGTNGNHPLPDPDTLARTFGRFGITRGIQVVAYDQNNGMFASRLWWLLRWLGHDAVAVLDGGFAKWVAEERPTASGARQRPARVFTATVQRDSMAVDAAKVATLTGRPDWLIVDARAPERYRGDIEPIYRVAGHIPGAANHFYKLNVDERGVFRPAEEIRKRFRETLGDAPPEHVVCYCGSGVSACHNLLALEHVGIRGARLYPGSWSEWFSDPSRPVELTKPELS